MLTLLISFVLIGLINIGISLPLILRQIGPNVIYGYRVRKTLENPEIWYEVNEYFAWRLLICGTIFLVCSILLYGVPGMNLDFYPIACLLTFIVPFIIGMSQTSAYLKRLPVEHSKSSTEGPQ